jgi:chromosome partitioning protein
MLDIDPQGSVAAWYEPRREAGIDDGPDASVVQGWKLSTEMDRLSADYDILIIDTPPHAETDARVAIRAAGLILVPVQPSPMDLWATKPTIELARREKSQPLLVLNRVPSRAKLTEAIRAKIGAEGMPLADTTLGNRSVFASSMMEGKGVLETQPKGAAADEIRALANEVAAALKLVGTRVA